MGHLNSHLLWHKYAERYFRDAGSILEIGPAGYPTYYEQELKKKVAGQKYVVLDVASDFISGVENNPGFVLSQDPPKYPFEDDAFDIVFSDQLIAHVEFFWIWYGELVRITKPGGYIITINAWSYPRCPSPIDAWRIHSDGMKVLNKYDTLETILSITQSLELKKYSVPGKTGYYFPGASITNPFGGTSIENIQINQAKTFWNKLVGKLPAVRAWLLNPVHVAFDTITIARKRVTPHGSPYNLLEYQT